MSNIKAIGFVKDGTKAGFLSKKNKAKSRFGVINNHAGGNAPRIAQKIADYLHLQKQRTLF